MGVKRRTLSRHVPVNRLQVHETLAVAELLGAVREVCRQVLGRELQFRVIATVSW